MNYQITGLDPENNVIAIKEIEDQSHIINAFQKTKNKPQQTDTSSSLQGPQMIIPVINSILIEKSLSITLKQEQYKQQMQQLRKLTILHVSQRILEQFKDQNLLLIFMLQSYEQILQSQFKFIICEENNIQLRVNWLLSPKALEIKQNKVILYLSVYISYYNEEVTLNVPFAKNSNQEQQIKQNIEESYQYSILEFSLFDGFRYYFPCYIDQIQYLQQTKENQQPAKQSIQVQEEIINKKITKYNVDAPISEKSEEVQSSQQQESSEEELEEDPEITANSESSENILFDESNFQEIDFEY